MHDEFFSQSGPAEQWPLIARFAGMDTTLSERAEKRGPIVRGLYEFLRFGMKQAWACLFGGVMLALLVLTRFEYPQHAIVSRYDFLFVCAVALQAFMLIARLETVEEAKIIFAFHLIGTIMEIHKTAVGSWIYPEPTVFHIGGVPLFTGFMYAAVGSYIARAWRLFHFHFSRHPAPNILLVLSAAIYANFFLDDHHVDLRFALLAITAVLFRNTIIYFRVWRTFRAMPLLIGFALVALFIWFGENVGTATGTWLYPRQMKHWQPVQGAKLTSWFLLMIVSYSLVAWIRGPIERQEEERCGLGEKVGPPRAP